MRKNSSKNTRVKAEVQRMTKKIDDVTRDLREEDD